MKMNKKKIAVIALILCFAAILSLGSLAWFSDNETVENTLMFTTDKDSGKTDFSVDLFEHDPNDPNTKVTRDGVVYTNLMPNMKISKDPTVLNDGQYNEYVRVSVTVNNYNFWKSIVTPGADGKVHLESMFVDIDPTKWVRFETEPKISKDGKSATFTYYLNEVLAPYNDTANNQVSLFTQVRIPYELTKEDADKMGDAFKITVTSEAIQADNLPFEKSTVTEAANARAAFDLLEAK